MRQFLCLGLLMLCLANACLLRAAEPDRFANEQLGISITKPKDWHFSPVELKAKNLESTQMDDQQLQELLQKHAQVPLVLMTRYHEPYDDLNPSIKILVKPLPNPERFDPVDALEFMLSPVKRAYQDAKIVQAPEIVMLGKHRSAYAKVHYSLKTKDGKSFPTCSELWVVPHGDYCLIIGAGSNQQNDAAEHVEIAKAIESLELKP